MIMNSQYKMSAVILCGGKSRRMGTDKAMLTAEGTPNAVRLLRALSGEGSPCTDVWLSIGSGESYPAIHAKKVSDRFPECGPMGGLEAALTICREEYLFVTPVDTPFADAQMARELMTYMADDSRQRDAVLVIDGEGRLQTLLGIYHKRVLPALTQRLLDGRREKLRIRDFLRDLDVVYVNAEALTDGVRKSTSCNTPQEWQRLMGQEIPGCGRETDLSCGPGHSGRSGDEAAQDHDGKGDRPQNASGDAAVPVDSVLETEHYDRQENGLQCIEFQSEGPQAFEDPQAAAGMVSGSQHS